jgi:hypothetical protein
MAELDEALFNSNIWILQQLPAHLFLRSQRHSTVTDVEQVVSPENTLEYRPFRSEQSPWWQGFVVVC